MNNTISFSCGRLILASNLSLFSQHSVGSTSVNWSAYFQEVLVLAVIWNKFNNSLLRCNIPLFSSFPTQLLKNTPRGSFNISKVFIKTINNTFKFLPLKWFTFWLPLEKIHFTFNFIANKTSMLAWVFIIIKTKITWNVEKF